MTLSTSSNNNANGPDGLTDDLNGDNVPDYYPTLYAGIFSPYNSNLTNRNLATWQHRFTTTSTNRFIPKHRH